MPLTLVATARTRTILFAIWAMKPMRRARCFGADGHKVQTHVVSDTLELVLNKLSLDHFFCHGFTRPLSIDADTHCGYAIVAADVKPQVSTLDWRKQLVRHFR